MNDWLSHAPAFMAGWAGCCVFIALAEWIADVEPFSDPMSEANGDVCAWPNDFEHFHPASVNQGGQGDHA